MIGIYKITNKSTGRAYIGQSVNIANRWRQHRQTNELYIDRSIQKYGVNAFIWEIIEECSVEQLDERESYWINTLNTFVPNGYNIKDGGSNRGEDNAQALLTEDEVRFLRKLYASHDYTSCKDIYNTYFKDNLIQYNSFREIFTGLRWSWVMPEVFTSENNIYYLKTQEKYKRTNNQNGSKNTSAILTENEVMDMREMYVTHERKDIFAKYPQYNERLITSIISGQNWKHLPIYKKREKKWYLKGQEINYGN